MTHELGFSLTWHGHSCTEIAVDGGPTILIDPWFGNPRSRQPAAAVDACDVMLVTHGHYDHLGGTPGELVESDAVVIARRTRPIWPCMHELSLWLEKVVEPGAEIVGMNLGGTVEARGARVTMVRADHSAGDWAANAETSLSFGASAGFVIELESGPRIYAAGDTDVFGDMALIGELYRPDVALLPIGGHFTMGPRGAARAAHLVGARTVIPNHYGTFPLLVGTPDQLRSELAELGREDIRVLAMEPGETVH